MMPAVGTKMGDGTLTREDASDEDAAEALAKRVAAALVRSSKDATRAGKRNDDFWRAMAVAAVNEVRDFDAEFVAQTEQP